EVNLKPLIDSVIEGYKGLALKKSITITNKCADHVIIDGDSNALSIMLSNLIGNALNYGHHKGVVNVDVIFEQEKLVLSVEDNGPGIPEKDRARIFDRFYRVLENQQYSPTGSGLGLAIVKSIVELHDAEIVLVDGINSGVKFNIIFTNKLRRS
ncbi:MAG TPA: sensor histidine kinase, partial [Gammaproteobacteria bacterium]|nr:sensor histidine kinase [Gammaproteobacteria bacterium]